MIRFNVSKAELNNPETLFKLVKNAIEKHNSQVVKPIKEDKSYYRGEIPRMKFIVNKAKYIVDMATELFIGTVPDIATHSKKDKERKRLIDLNKKLKLLNFDKHLYNVGHNLSKCGSGFLLTYTEEGDEFPRFASLDPELTNVVYDCSIAENSLFAFTLAEQTEYVGNETKKYYRVYLYTDTLFYDLKTFSNTDFTISGVNSVVEHHLGRVPISEFVNNSETFGDARPVYKLLDASSKLLNDRSVNIDDALNYLLMLKNVRVGNEEEQEQFVKLLKEEKVLAIEGDEVDARFLTNVLDQSQLQRLQDYIDKAIHVVSRVPDLSSADFVQSTSEPALKLKLKGFLDLVKQKERNFTPSLMRVLKMILYFVARQGGAINNKYYFDLEEVDIKYSHSLPSNDQEMITQIMNLKNSGLLNPTVALQNITWIDNVESYLEGIIKEEPKPSGFNEHNKNLQDQQPQEEKQKDNLNNFNKGNSQKL